MKIAILYICIGKYNVFWDGFYNSCITNFLTSYEKDFFVFCDKDIFANYKNVKYFHTDDLGWPYNTLYRFKMFNSINDLLEKYDYIYFFNANTYFNTLISDEILPIKEGLVFVQHFKFVNSNNIFFPYDRNKRCLAYVPYGDGKDYIQACLLGGKTNDFLNMSKLLDENISTDENNKIIARWHDESHVNHYILSKNYKLLPPNYASNKLIMDIFEPKIIMRLKTDYYPLEVIRNKKTSLFSAFITKCNNQLLKLRDVIYYITHRHNSL